MQTATKEQPKNLYRRLRSEAGKIDTKAGRMVFGDDNPLTRHIRYNIGHAIIKARAAYKPEPGPRLFTPGQLSEKGYVVFDNPYSPELVRTIAKRVTEGFSDRSQTSQRDGEYSLHISNVFKTVPEVRDLVTPAIINALNDYYGAYTDIAMVSSWRNFPPDANAPPGVYSSSWHTDRRSPTLMKLFYLVNDTTENDGPFHIMDRQNTREVIRTDYTTRLEMDRLDQQRDKYFKLTGKAGSILIGNTTMCLHKAGLPAPGHFRDIIQFSFFPSARPLPANWMDDKARCQIGLGNKGL